MYSITMEGLNGCFYVITVCATRQEAVDKIMSWHPNDDMTHNRYEGSNQSSVTFDNQALTLVARYYIDFLVRG